MPEYETTTVEGLKELEDNLLHLPENLAKLALRSAARKASLVFQRIAKGNVPVKTGNLRDGIKVIGRIKSLGVQGAEVYFTIGLRLRPKDMSAYYGKFLEFGTASHEITATFKKVLAAQGIIIGKEVTNPGMSAKPFMRPAFDSGREEALQVFAKELAINIDKAVKKVNQKS